jgi:hypothetical protein
MGKPCSYLERRLYGTFSYGSISFTLHNSFIQVYELAMGRSFFDRDILGESVPYLHAIVFGDYPEEMIARGKFRDVFFNQDGG